MASIFNISTEKQETSSLFNSNENESCFPKLSYKERLIGFLFVSFLGYFLEILSFGASFGVIAGKPEKFAVLYSLGNIFALIGTSFLIGFKKQLYNMVDKERLFTSLIFVSSLIMTLVSALVFKAPLLVLVFIILQFGSYFWYVASYIPFARTCIKSCLKGCIGK